MMVAVSDLAELADMPESEIVALAEAAGCDLVEVAARWHPTRTGRVRPEQVVAATRDAHWWRGPRGHAWRGRVRDRTLAGRGCPGCAEGPG